MNQRQSKQQEAVETCIVCTVHEVLGKPKQGFQDGWVMWLESETRENAYEIGLEDVKETGLLEILYEWMVG
jgi:hypothetical protein